MAMKKTLILFILAVSLLFGQETGVRYLIITADSFYNDILPLAQWKHKKGLSIKVVKLSETGSSASQIRSYIVNAYNNWIVKPEYLLLVGAPNYIPFAVFGTIYTDNYYTDMDGDTLNEILSGRLTVHSHTECQTVVNKILAYERTPDTTTTAWYTRGCLIANLDYDSDDTIYWGDVHYYANLMVADGYTRIDTLSDYYGDDYNDVYSAVNEGRMFLLYRGSGTNNWYTPFDCNPDVVTNGKKMPIVLSMTCNTIGRAGSAAVAERWFLTGSPTNLRGGAGYFATTTSISNGAYLRSSVARGFADGVFTLGKRTFGQCCENGRSRVFQMYHNTSGLHEYWGFTTIGDPEMNIWTAPPARIDVTHDTSLIMGPDSLLVTVRRSSVPVESALVCIALDSTVYETGYTGADGETNLHFTTNHAGLMSVTVTGENLYPYEGSVVIYDTNPCLAYSSYRINDSLGNANGIPNNGETVLLNATLKNISPNLARGVRAVIRSGDSLVQLIDTLAIYPNIPAYDSAASLNPFALAISPFCPDGHVVPIHLLMRAQSGDTWPADLGLTIRNISGATGPDPYGYYIYDDTDTLSGRAPVYDWFEIDPATGGPGALVNEITDEDDDTVSYPLPFIFRYYNLEYDSIGLCSNGFSEMGGATSRTGKNTDLPCPGEPKRLLAPFWDDLAPNVNGDISSYSDTINHRWILEFNDCSHRDSSVNRETFQLILRDPQYYPTPTGDGEALYMYRIVENATSNSVGIKDETEARGLRYVFNGNYGKNAAVLVSGRALLVTTTPPAGSVNTPWLYLLRYTLSDSADGNNNGIPEPGEIVVITAHAENRGDTTAYNVDGLLATDDPDAAIIDSFAGFGDIAVHDTADNRSAPYRFQIDSLPADSVIGFRLRLRADGGYATQDYFTIHLFIQLGAQESTPPCRLSGPSLNVFPNPARNRVMIRIKPGKVHSAPLRGSGASFQDFPTERIELTIYDVSGRLIRSFALCSVPYALCWNCTDQTGRTIPAGVYFVRLESGSQRRTVKLIRLR
jgi:hypothetical protein